MEPIAQDQIDLQFSPRRGTAKESFKVKVPNPFIGSAKDDPEGENLGTITSEESQIPASGLSAQISKSAILQRQFSSPGKE